MPRELAGDTVRLSDDVKSRHDALGQGLDNYAKAPENASRKQEIEQLREAVRTLEKQQLSQLQEVAEQAAKAHEWTAMSIERVETAQKRDAEELARRPTEMDVKRLADDQTEQTRDLQDAVLRFREALEDHRLAVSDSMRESEHRLIATLSDRNQVSRTDIINAALADAKRKSDELANDLIGTIRNYYNELRAIEARLKLDEDISKAFDDDAQYDVGRKVEYTMREIRLENDQQRKAASTLFGQEWDNRLFSPWQEITEKFNDRLLQVEHLVHSDRLAEARIIARNIYDICRDTFGKKSASKRIAISMIGLFSVV